MIRGFDVETFQKRINERVGLNKDGKPIIRLSYAPLVFTRVLGEEVPRYWTKRWKDGGTWKYDQPDRFVFEKRLEREAYWDAFNATRFQYVEATGETLDLGPPPEDYYVFDSLIAVHSGHKAESGEPQCCEEAWQGTYKFDLTPRGELVKVPVGGRQRCWGQYREPNDSDMRNIERAAQELKHGKYYDPYAPLSPHQLAAIETEANMQASRIADEVNKYEQEMGSDFDYLHGWRLFEASAKKLAHGKYHFLGSTWKKGKAGLAIPD
ncbi:MAG TPA: hypothetical protein VN256_13185 [Pyrinomonadaceae bacterium]|nr:hypothetical protein [Pyrinomonadaceae bacterium]